MSTIRAVPSAMRARLNGAALPIVGGERAVPRRKPVSLDVRAVALAVRVVSSIPAPLAGVVAWGIAWLLGWAALEQLWFPVCAGALSSWAIAGARWSGKWYPKARSFVVAHLGGPVSAEAREVRLATCAGCPWLAQKRGRMYCGRCDCGTHPAARLSWKSWLRWAECPAGRWKAD